MLPEYHLTNWLPKDPSFAGLCDQWETYLKKYQDLAKECGICIVPGTIVEGHRGEEKEEDRLLNVCYFIGKEGEIVGKYVKKNLWYVHRLMFFIMLCCLTSLRLPSLLEDEWKRSTLSLALTRTRQGAQSAIT